MVYREPADELARRAGPPAEKGPLVRLDAGGRDGANGRDGAAGSYADRSGEDGERGGDAGPAAAGEHGGAITIVLRADERREDVAYLSGMIASGAQGERRVEDEIAFRRAGEIELLARGGRGGNGGRGGDGGAGARGKTGSSASRWSSGDDGGPGGDGGDGGDGSSGADGGDGGSIVVRVSEEDTPLLMLVSRDVRGGKGGEMGANGDGGDGGRGGEGGASYSWTDTESYTDSNGNTQTRTTYHSNPGGSDGPRGRNGRPGSARLQDGRKGEQGSFAIEVRDSAGRIATYPSRYDVRLVSFRHRNENDDGIYEPEEKVFVSHVEIENIGGMPLPKHHDVVVKLVDDGWIAPVAEQKLVLPRELGPGERHVFDRDELALALRVFRPQRSGAALAAPETIRLVAELPRVFRRFGAFETPTSAAQGGIVIRFPVEVSEPTALFSLAPGQATRIRWKITNVSEKPFGVESIVGRAVGVRLVLDGGELGSDAVHFLDDGGAHVPLAAGFDRGIPRIAESEGIAFEGTIAIPSDAPLYASARLVVSAELGHIDDPSRVRAVHLQEIRVRVSRPFDAKKADVLFVVNNRTTAEELTAWESIAGRCGLVSSVWDASLEGSVSVLDDVAAGTRAYSLVVVLDNVFDTAEGEKRAGDLLTKATNLELARRGTHVLYVGKPPDLETLLVPTAGDARELTDDAIDDALLAACEGAPIGAPAARFTAREWFLWPWSKPTERQLDERANALTERLAKRFPDRRYIVTHAFEPRVVRRVAWLREMALGTLEVRRTLDAARGAITSVAVTSKTMHDGAFGEDKKTFAAFLSALPFSEKLARLAMPEESFPYGASHVATKAGCGDALVAAALADLLREQCSALVHGWRMKKANLVGSLPLLAALIAEGTRIAMPRFIELVAWLDLVARGHTRFWEWVPPFVFLRRGPQLRAIVRDALTELVAKKAGGDVTERKALTMAIASRRKELRRALNEKHADMPTPLTPLAYAMEHLEGRLDRSAVQIDGGVLQRAADRVRTQSEHAAIAATDTERGGRARSVLASAANAKSTLLRSETCGELLARAGFTPGPKMRVEPAAAEPAIAEIPAQIADDGSSLGLAELREESPEILRARRS